jgi:uncharacterized protein (TIGR02284 family)
MPMTAMPVNKSNQLISSLNHLLTRHHDATKGYQEVQEKVENKGFTKIFSDLVFSRKSFSRDLETEIKAMGYTPNNRSSIEGDLHRTWIKLKDLFVNGDEEEILEEVIRGEEYLLKAYVDVLENENLSGDLYKKLEKQHNIIQADVRRMKIMHETMANN